MWLPFPDMAEARGKSGFRGALGHRDFRLLLASLTTSGTGDWFYNVALVVLILDQTDSAAWVAAGTIGRLVPYVVFSTIGGALADRYGRRRVMIAADFLRAALMLLLTVAAILSAPIVIAIVIAFLSTAAGTPFFPAVAATTPSVVDEKSLASANALISTVDSLSIAIGPALGGLILLFGPPEIAFAVNAVTFVASALFLSRLTPPPEAQATEATEESQTLRGQLVEGMKAMTSSSGVAFLVALLVAATLTYGEETVLYPLVSRDLLSTGSQGVGFIFAAIGVGGVLGASLTPRVADHPRPSIILAAGSIVAAAPLVTLPFVRVPVVAYLLVAVEGAGFIFVDVLGTTLLQRAVPPEITARVFGLLDSVAVAGMVAGALLAPIIITAFGLEAALFVAGGVLVVLTLLSFPKLRELDGAADRRMRELAPRVELLGSLDIFRPLPRQSLEALAASITEQRVASGHVLIKEGAEADDFFVIASGTMEVLSSGEWGGAPAKIRDLKGGDYAGEIGLVERIPRTATVRATSDGLVYRIRGEDFLDTVNQSPALSGPLFAGIAGRMARTHPTHSPAAPPQTPEASL